MLITRRRIADQFEKRGKVEQASRLSKTFETAIPLSVVSADDSARTSTVERVPDPASVCLEAFWDEQWQKHLLNTAMEKVKTQVSPKQFQMFDLYVCREWPVEKVAKTLGVSAGQVYLTKHRISGLLKKEVRKLERKAPLSGVPIPAAKREGRSKNEE
jgi:DNA-directed RNA polymerase specialized sigma24 family protein